MRKDEATSSVDCATEESTRLLDSCLVSAECEGGDEGLRSWGGEGFATFQDLGLHVTISFWLEAYRIVNEDKLKRNDSLLTFRGRTRLNVIEI